MVIFFQAVFDKRDHLEEEERICEDIQGITDTLVPEYRTMIGIRDDHEYLNIQIFWALLKYLHSNSYIIGIRINLNICLMIKIYL